MTTAAVPFAVPVDPAPGEGPTELCAAEVEEARVLLRSFAAASGAPALWRSLIEAVERDPELPDDAVLPAGTRPAEFHEALGVPPATLVVREEAGRRLVSVGRPVAELDAFLAGCSPRQRAALTVLLMRAASPLRALETWPLEALFSAEEIGELHRLRPGPAPAAPPGPSYTWQPGEAVRYRSYANVVLKVTRLCNLRCTYCHDWGAGPGQIMPFEVLAATFHRVLYEAGNRTVDFVWHGGEPLLIGRRAYLRILRMQQFFRRPGQTVGNRLQTNGTRLDERWAGFLRRYAFSVSVSVDGPGEHHDVFRRDAAGRPTFDRVVAAVRRATDAGILFQVLVVVDPTLIAMGARRVLAFLQELGVPSVGLLPVRPDNGPGDGGAMVSRRRYWEFLLELHELRRSLGESGPGIRELDALTRALRGGFAGHCELLGQCVGAFFVVDVDGSVAHCDKFTGDPAFTIGDIRSTPLTRAAPAPALVALGTRTGAATEPMRGCRWFSACQGWCPHERYLAERDPDGPGDCCGLQDVFSRLAAE